MSTDILSFLNPEEEVARRFLNQAQLLKTDWQIERAEKAIGLLEAGQKKDRMLASLEKIKEKNLAKKLGNEEIIKSQTLDMNKGFLKFILSIVAIFFLLNLFLFLDLQI